MVWIEHTAIASGSKRKSVTCCSCGQQYSYIATRQGWGYGASDPYFLFSKRAKRFAGLRASDRLAARLDRAVDPVPCPHCGTLQPNMVRSQRWRQREKVKTILFFGVLLIALAGLAIFQILAAIRH